MKRSIAKYITILGIVLLFLASCSKNNHDTLVSLGDEHYIKPIDSIYPAKYRAVWYSLAPISIQDPNYNKIYEGIFPPDLTGKYVLEASFGRGNDSIVNNLGQTIPYTFYQPTQNIIIDIMNQRNGLASLNYREEYDDPHIPAFEITIDSAYVFGNGADNTFTICFDMVESYYGDDNYSYGVLITGKLMPDGMSDVNKWKLFKGGGSGFVVGGQHYYYDDFAEKVE